MKKPKITKGKFGYLKKRKGALFLRCAILFLGSAGLILTGYLTTGERVNLLALAGALTAIPFAMLLVSFLAIVGVKPRDKAEYEKVEAIVKAGVIDCDLIIANKDGANYYFPYIYIHETGIYAFLVMKKPDEKKAAEYVRNFLRLNSCDAEMTVLTDFTAYCHRLRSLSPSDRETCDEKLLQIEGVLRAISM